MSGLSTLPHPRIVFLDMEGTLLGKEYRLDDGIVAPSAWTLLADALGPDCLAAENETKQKWLGGHYSGYLEWMRDTISIHKQYGLTEGVFRDVVESVRLVENAAAALERIHARGSVSVLITGGFKALADRVQRALRIHHSFAACEYFFDQKTGLIEHFNLLPADEVGKVDFMRLVCREYGTTPKECVFVGDGKNDVHLAKEVGFSIAFNGQPELCAVTSICIRQAQGQEDFMPVAEAIFDRFS